MCELSCVQSGVRSDPECWGRSAQRGVLSVGATVQERPWVQGSAVASLLARVPILLVTYSPQGEGSQRAGDPASDPANA